MSDSCAFIDEDTEKNSGPNSGVFLSYSSQDRPAVMRISEALRLRGVASTWIDRDRLVARTQWWQEIEEAISTRSHVVVLVSPTALNSEYVQKEVEFATNTNKRVVPVILSHVDHADIPEVINRWHFGPVYDADDENGFLMELANLLPRPRRFLLPRMIEIPSGEFPMAYDQRPTYLDRFWIGKTSITYAEFACFIRSRGYDEEGNWPAGGKSKSRTLPRTADWYDRIKDEADTNPLQPVRGVTWYEAAAYCQWLSHFSDCEIKLPGEAQWEKAARGTDARSWPFGNEWSDELARSGMIGPSDCCVEGTDSPYGCLDMAGHIWNWTDTIDSPQESGPDAESPDLTSPRIIRGGSWKQNSYKARTFHRESQFPNANDYAEQIGFRVVTDSPPSWSR